jgi:SAM-dependent methyltransferase
MTPPPTDSSLPEQPPPRAAQPLAGDSLGAEGLKAAVPDAEQMPWCSYDELARAGQYGGLLDEQGAVALGKDALREVHLFQETLGGCGRVLDLGCGPGYPGVLVARRVGRVCGVDRSPAMLELASRGADALGASNVDFVLADAARLPFADCSFDGVAACGCFSAMPQPQNAAAELARISARSARLAVLEQDFAARLAPGSPRTTRAWRRRGDRVFLQVVEVVASPPCLRETRFVLWPGGGLYRRWLNDATLAATGSLPTDETGEDLSPAEVCEVRREQEAMFDAAGLRQLLTDAGFGERHLTGLELRGTAHLFAVFERQ